MLDVVVIDETSIQIGDMNFWFWFVMDPETRNPETRKIVFFMISRSITNITCKNLIHKMWRMYGIRHEIISGEIRIFDNY